MGDCGCHAQARNEAERRILRVALVLNATMFLVGVIAGIIAQSMGLIADSLDMLADACAYGIALVAWNRSARFKASAAQLSGTLLLILGCGVLSGVVWRLLMGSLPEGFWMMGVALISLVVNATVLRLLDRFRHGEVHLRATWLFTRVDVIANLAVIMSGVLVLWFRSAIPDLIIGTAIALYVIKEAAGILSEARQALVSNSEAQ